MFKKSLLILLFIFWAQQSSCTIELLVEIAKNGWKLIEILNNAKSTKDTGTDIISLLTNADDHAEVVQTLNVMNHKLDDLKSYIKDKEHYIALLIEQLPSELAIQSKKADLDEFIVTTNWLWDKLMSYVGSRSTEMFPNLAVDILSKLDSPLQNFRQVLTPLPGTTTSPDNGLFMLIIKGADQKRDILCNQGETSHHAVVRLFYIAMSTEIKAHTLLFLANLLIYPKNDAWRRPLETRFREQFNRAFEMFSKSLKIARLPYIRSCDPDVWQTDKNYYGLYGYLQQTIYYLFGCGQKKYPFCEDLNEGRGTVFFGDGRNCSIIPLNEYAKCDGRPFGCKVLESTFKDINTCAWEEGPYRIRFVKHRSDTYGTDKESIANDDLTCSPGNGYSKPGWQRLGDREVACSCQCPESRVKVMRQLMHSRTTDNCVIVGLRIHKVENYIYIQIAEGKLEANGHISDHSWVPSTRNLYSYWGINSQLASAQRTQNLFFLGDVQLTPGYVLTGIQFTWLPIEKLSGFAVLIYGMKFDYKTGKLDKNQRFRGPVQHGENYELKFPTKTPINKTENERTTPKSDGYTHVKLQRSDLSDDYGQTTLPLLDGVPILTNPLSPIGGVGLFYKGYAEDYAGFLSLRLYPVNYTYFMETFKESHDVNSLLNWNN